jgi:hypothetical protein
MGTKRDDFTKKTIDLLGKRVAFRCSNPDCNKITIGPNDEKEKATIIGIAAHITAASPEGPRFNSELTEEERRHIDNGIWLCSNCATLIDKDVKNFPVDLLNDWKRQTESTIYNQLLAEKSEEDTPKELPFLEADIIWTHGGRWNRGYSPKNKPVIQLGIDKPIIYWELDWNFTILIHNNSRYDAYNVQVETIGDNHFSSLTKLNKVNNLPALQHIEVSAKLFDHLEGTYIEADALLKKQIPVKANGLCLKITYQDESRKHNIITYATIDDNQFNNVREI